MTNEEIFCQKLLSDESFSEKVSSSDIDLKKAYELFHLKVRDMFYSDFVSIEQIGEKIETAVKKLDGKLFYDETWNALFYISSLRLQAEKDLIDEDVYRNMLLSFIEEGEIWQSVTEVPKKKNVIRRIINVMNRED